ncbi:MAG: DUF4440 domain-containing protein [Rhodanobacter sp.]
MLASTPEEAVKMLDEAFGRADLDGVLAFYEDEAVLVIEPGRVARGKDELERFFLHVFALKGHATQIETKVLESGDIALFTSRWQFVGTTPDATPFQKESIATSVFRRGIDGGWRMVIDNSHGPAILPGLAA